MVEKRFQTDRIPTIVTEPQPSTAIGIEAEAMPYAAWYLFNQGICCLNIDANVGALACLSDSAEICLRRLTQSSKKRRFKDVIDLARGNEIITDAEAKDLQELRRFRNSYIHFDLKTLPIVDELRRVQSIDVKTGEVVAGAPLPPYPSEREKDLLPFVASAGLAAIYSERIRAMYQRLFPQQKTTAQPAYMRFRFVEIRRQSESKP